MACNWLMVTSSGDNNGRVGVWVCSPTKLKIPKAEQETAQPTAARFNKTFIKRKNRALLTVRRLQKHYEIFGNNVLRKNITRKQLRLRDSKLAKCLVCKRFSHSLHSVVA